MSDRLVELRRTRLGVIDLAVRLKVNRAEA